MGGNFLRMVSDSANGIITSTEAVARGQQAWSEHQVNNFRADQAELDDKFESTNNALKGLGKQLSNELKRYYSQLSMNADIARNLQAIRFR